MHLLSNFVSFFIGRASYEASQLPLTLLILLIAALITKYPVRLFATFEDLVRKLSDRPYLSAALIAVIAVCARLSVSPFVGTPQPVVPDEPSLMLQAKTYLAGRMANQVDLLPDFESVYVILSPTYASMYPVLRSFPLLVGYFLGIGAWGGVLLSVVALTMAVYWIVRQSINANYAFIAALIVIIRFGLFSFWVNSYFGGAFTALGGVLLLGGFKAVRSRPSILNGAVLGLGVVIVMTTRPYEGMVYAIPFGLALIVHFIRSAGLQRRSLVPAGLAAAVLVAAGFGLTLAQNQAVTGDWKVAPYFLYRQTNGQVPVFLTQSRHPESQGQPRYAATLAAVSYDVAYYDHRKTWVRILYTEISRALNYWSFYVGFALLIPLLFGLRWLSGERTLLLAAASLAVGLSLETFDFAHYASPGFGLAVLTIMAGFRTLRQWRPWGYLYGLSLSRLLPLALVVGSAIPVSSALTGWPDFSHNGVRTWEPCCWLRPSSVHMAVADEVDRYGGRHLIIVDSGPQGAGFGRFVSPAVVARLAVVYNDADIDGEKTIWINNDSEFNRAAIDRYPGRRIWRLGWLDDGAVCLQRFDIASNQPGAPDIAPPLSDQKGGWLPGSPGRCPEGLVHAPVGFFM
jgi:hypothetical protein